MVTADHQHVKVVTGQCAYNKQDTLRTGHDHPKAIYFVTVTSHYFVSTKVLKCSSPAWGHFLNDGGVLIFFERNT
jgi:hypothetical protein